MMKLQLATVLLGLFLFSTAVDATVKESLELKVFNPNFKISDVKMLELLNKTDLERYGYKKEVTTKLVSGPGSDKPQYHKSYFYYKIVDCSRLREIDQELQTLLPGILGVDLVTKINSEIKTKNLTTMKQCKVGLEVHLKDAEGCYDQKKNVRRRKRGGCGWCFICLAAQLSN